MQSSLTRSTPCRVAVLLAVIAAVLAALTVACCRDFHIKLGRISDFLVGVFDISIGGEVEISGYVDVDFSGDFSAWSQISSFDDVEIATDLSAATYSAAELKYDVDYDAKKEKIRVLRAENAGAPLLFLAWRGDDYTTDNKVCYLGWTEDQLVTLAAAFCKQDNGAMYCQIPAANEDALSCERCDDGGSCNPCDMNGTIKKCLPDKQEGAGVDLDIDIDIDIDIDLDVDVEPPVDEG